MKPVLLPQLQLPRLWFGLGLLIAAGIATGSLLPRSQLPDLGVADKWEHGFAYLLLSFWFASIVSRGNYPGLIAALFAFGGALELLQGFMGAGRLADPMDLVANSAGILCGLALAMTPAGQWVRRIDSLYLARGSA